jgi:hypothetical protein
VTSTVVAVGKKNKALLATVTVASSKGLLVFLEMFRTLADSFRFEGKWQSAIVSLLQYSS